MQLKWYDWITPTTPFASILIGSLFILFLTLIIWLDTKSYRITGLFLLAGFVVIVISAATLNRIGIYG